MKNSERNRLVLENFVLYLTHCSKGQPGFKEPFSITPEQLYKRAHDYIEQDHIDGEDNLED